MERAPVVLGRAVLVSASSCQLRPNGCSQDAHLLGGRGFFRSLLVLLRATGSKPWTRSSDGGGTAKEVDCATSCSGSNEAWRHNEGRFACIKGRASLSRADAARDGRSRRAIATDDVEMARCRDGEMSRYGPADAVLRDVLQISGERQVLQAWIN
jgi:hypothetical protein